MKYDYKNFVMPTDDQLREMLTPEQYKITQAEGTEPPFENAYHDNKAIGIYVDIISKYPLFLSKDKFDSGTGWPSFTKPIDGVKLIEKVDNRFGMRRVEVISPSSHSHLGHVFPDGPIDAGGMRYCMNSGALEFIAFEDMDEFGYGEYKAMFLESR